MNAQEDDGFREIQLNGKQLVFLVMAATTVLAVSFMLGMLVGRGVRAEREEAVNLETLEATPPTPERRTPSEVAAGNPYAATPPEPVDDEPPVAVKRSDPAGSTSEPAKADAPADKSVAAPPARTAEKPADTPSVKPAATAAKPADDKPSKTQAPPQNAKALPAEPPPAPAPAPAPTPAAAKPAPAVGSGPGSGYAVQVAAVNDRGEADAIVKRLSGKGYAAYVETPKGGTSVFRVRVGTFETRSAAQSVADRLTREERFKPWVTR